MSGADFTELWRRYLIGSNADVAALAIVTLDYCLTFPDEVAYFWRKNSKKWISIPALLFFSNRYWALLVVTLNTIAKVGKFAVNHEFCNIYLRYIYFNTGMINILLVQLIMATRVSSMYTNRRAMAMCLIITSLFCLGSNVVTINAGAGDVFNATSPDGIEHECLSFSVGIQQIANWTVWMPILIYDWVVFGLVATKSVGFLRKHPLQGGLGTRLVKVIMRDSIAFFGSIVILYAANAWTWGHNQAGLIQNITIAINSSLSSRMLLNLRKEAAYNQYQDAVSSSGVRANIDLTTRPSSEFLELQNVNIVQALRELRSIGHSRTKSGIVGGRR